MSTRSFVLSIANSSVVRRYFALRGMNNPRVRRYVAGDNLRDALLTVKEFKDRGIVCALDFLGENVLNEQEARHATEQYREVVKQIAIFAPDSYASIKLTALGLDIGEDLVKENLRALTDEARSRGGVFIRVDMEGSAYTDRTLNIVCEEHEHYPHIGTVIQSYLRRSDADIDRLLKLGISMRLVKGAYAEPPHIAYARKADVDAAYRKQMYLLMDKGNRPAIATQDEEIIKVAKRYAQQNNVGKDRFEFQMLLGIRRDLQESLTQEGYTMRIYVPFGEQWYPYFTRRLAERPENVGFVLKHLGKG